MTKNTKNCTTILLQFLATFMLYRFVTAVDDGLLVNGDFETGPGANGTSTYATEAAGVRSLPAWSVEGMVEYIEAGQRQGNMLLVVPEGKHAVRLGNDAQISQSLKVLKGTTYSLTFSAARTCAQLESLNVSVPPATRDIDLQTLYNIRGWDDYAWAFRADSEDVQVVFHNPGLEDDPSCGPIIDSVAIKQITMPVESKDNLAVNGDFEEGPWMFPNATLGVLLPTNLDVTTSPLPGWIVESNKAVRYIDSNHHTVPEGKRAVELLAGKEGIISQMVDTEPGKKYTMSFLLGDAGNNCQTPMAVMAFAGDQADNFHYSPAAIRSYEPNNVTFTAKAQRTRIAFYSIYYNTRKVDRSSLCGPVIDQVKVIDPSKSGAGAIRLLGINFFHLCLLNVFTVAVMVGLFM
uniref:TSA: Wollemia nobilis Ref_Wollemi_Transcript_6229_1354 transcribed RNA sequence n=1 Tax=Wollemia nobilis TaxID=56998 RepID=A0A0C9RXD1_9CONI